MVPRGGAKETFPPEGKNMPSDSHEGARICLPPSLPQAARQQGAVRAAHADLQPATDEYDPSGPADAAKGAPTAPSRATVLLGEAIEEGDPWLVEAALAAGADREARDKVGGGGHGGGSGFGQRGPPTQPHCRE